MAELIKIRVFVLTPKKVSEHFHKIANRHGADAFAFYRHGNDTNYAVWAFGASTKTRLHEIGHCKLLHCKREYGKKRIFISEYITEELEAELYAFKICGKHLTLNPIFDIASEATRYCNSSNYAFNKTLKVLKDNEVILDKQQRSNLWQALKDFQKAGRPETFENNYF